MLFFQHFLFLLDTMKATLYATLIGHQNPIFALESSYDPRYLYTGGSDLGVVEWDLEEKKFNRILCSVPASVYALHLIPGTHLLAIGLRSGGIMIVDIDKQELVAKLAVDSGAVFAIQSLTERSELIASGEDGKGYVWCLKDFKLLYQFKISDTTVRVLNITDDGHYIVFGDKDGFIHSYSGVDYEKIAERQVHSMPVTSLLFNRGRLLSGGRDAKLNVLSVPELDNKYSFVPHMFTVYGISKHPTHPIIATVSRDKTTKVWDETSLKLLLNVSRDRRYEGHHLSINNCMWSSYKNLLISVSDDSTIKVWEIDM